MEIVVDIKNKLQEIYNNEDNCTKITLYCFQIGIHNFKILMYTAFQENIF